MPFVTGIRRLNKWSKRSNIGISAQKLKIFNGPPQFFQTWKKKNGLEKSVPMYACNVWFRNKPRVAKLFVMFSVLGTLHVNIRMCIYLRQVSIFLSRISHKIQNVSSCPKDFVQCSWSLRRTLVCRLVALDRLTLNICSFTYSCELQATISYVNQWFGQPCRKSLQPLTIGNIKCWESFGNIVNLEWNNVKSLER